MNYVVAGYVVALATLFVYALTLVWRRRRWSRAFDVVRANEVTVGGDVQGHGTPPVSSGRP